MDTTNFVKVAGTTALAAFVPFGGPLAAIALALTHSQDEVKAAESKGLASLEEEARKQHVLMEFQSHQARVAQEMAIANRINCSREVEIEEFYDDSSALGGEAGVKLSQTPTIKIGAKHVQHGVVKRIYRFKGGVHDTSDSSNGQVA